jgi:hypothetical protein
MLCIQNIPLLTELEIIDERQAIHISLLSWKSNVFKRKKEGPGR